MSKSLRVDEEAHAAFLRGIAAKHGRTSGGVVKQETTRALRAHLDVMAKESPSP